MIEIELIKEIQAGNISAPEKIFEKYKDEMLKYCIFLTGNINVSEDIVQESFIECFKSAKKLKNPHMFNSWFYKIVTRTAWRYIAKEKKVIPIENIYEKADMQVKDNSIDLFIKQEEAEILDGEIEKLDLKQKTVIVLYYFNDFSIKEIANIMGCFEGTVKSRLYTARRKLRDSILDNQNYLMDDRFHLKEGKKYFKGSERFEE